MEPIVHAHRHTWTPSTHKQAEHRAARIRPEARRAPPRSPLGRSAGSASTYFHIKQPLSPKVEVGPIRRVPPQHLHARRVGRRAFEGGPALPPHRRPSRPALLALRSAMRLLAVPPLLLLLLQSPRGHAAGPQNTIKNHNTDKGGPLHKRTAAMIRTWPCAFLRTCRASA